MSNYDDCTFHFITVGFANGEIKQMFSTHNVGTAEELLNEFRRNGHDVICVEIN